MKAAACLAAFGSGVQLLLVSVGLVTGVMCLAKSFIDSSVRPWSAGGEHGGGKKKKKKDKAEKKDTWAILK